MKPAVFIILPFSITNINSSALTQVYFSFSYSLILLDPVGPFPILNKAEMHKESYLSNL